MTINSKALMTRAWEIYHEHKAGEHSKITGMAGWHKYFWSRALKKAWAEANDKHGADNGSLPSYCSGSKDM